MSKSSLTRKDSLAAPTNAAGFCVCDESRAAHFFSAGWRMLCALTMVVVLSPFPAGAANPELRETVYPTSIRITPERQRAAAEHGVGAWIWTTNFADKQICRVWKSFSLPSTNRIKSAILNITADNLYRLYLDGREIGEGGNWRSLTQYDITYLLVDAGQHVLAVEALNDSMEGGILLGVRIQFMDGQEMNVLSDETWRVVPNNEKRWYRKTRPSPAWPKARIVGVVGQDPWWLHPVSTIPTPPLRLPDLRFWQSGWFLASILAICAVALALSLRLTAKLALQTRAQELLETERARIARDIHDDLGAALTELVLHGEVAQTEFPGDSREGMRFRELCDRARSASHALDEVVWAVNSKRDTLRDFSSYLCKYAQAFLASTQIRCRLDVKPNMPSSVFDLPVRRGLLLAVKEALNNAAKHSNASEVYVRIHPKDDEVVVVIEDNGTGFDPDTLPGDRNGLLNMAERLADLGGVCSVSSTPGAGCRVEFRMPLAHPSSRSPFTFRRFLPKRKTKPGVDLGSVPAEHRHQLSG
ncbi:MAG TPA: ATP-binding protein [Verrucomicrobiae bacterium]|nr:ATP-binding protein [Verrucomicrobiae bacterium]